MRQITKILRAVILPEGLNILSPAADSQRCDVIIAIQPLKDISSPDDP